VSHCSKPGCARAGTAVLGYDYSERLAVLDDPGEPSPHVYLLCTDCAARLRPPMGWTLRDRRTSPPLFLERDLPVERDGQLGLDSMDADEHPSHRREVRRVFFGQSA
jgi:hypothetical protein